ncbi:TPA: hypothetical protein G8O67_003235 [Salmonella enterica]|uniref:Uncharacterized protein n=1 Tax=Salmonella enterica TaxID=28901 RepID=A0A756I687_SALER|nr:hypothetical protein [Salmonella enterica]
MSKNTIKRSCTAGIPDFVPRKSTADATHHSQAKSTYYPPDVPEQTLPPVTPCFSQADIDEFLARKPKQYKMTERDYKELGRNTFLGLASLFDGLVTATVICAPVVAEMLNTKNTKNKNESGYGYGPNGYGYYSDGIKIFGSDS